MSKSGSSRLLTGALCAAASWASMPAQAAADLTTAYLKALDQNPQYQAAQAQYRYDLEARPQALSKLLPQLAGKADASLNKSTDKGILQLGDLGDFNIDRTDSYKAPLYAVQLTQALFRPAYFIGLNQADLQMSAAQLVLDDTRAGLMVSVAQAYFRVLAAQDAVRFLTEERDAFKVQLEQSTGRHDAGLLSDADFEGVKAEHDLAEAALIGAQGNLQVELTQLAEVTGETYTQVKSLADEVELAPPVPNDIGKWVSQAVDQNLEVLVANLNADIAKLDYDKARATRLPTIDLVGAYQYQHPTGGAPLGPREQVDQVIGLELKAPIYTGGAIDSGIRATLENWNKSKFQAEKARGMAVKDVRSAFFALNSGLSQIDALKQALQSTRAAEEAARVGFDVGTKTAADLMKAIDNRYKAEKNYASARYDFLINTLLLKQAVGALATSDLELVNRWLR